MFATDTGAHRITLEPAQCSIRDERGEPLVLSPAGTHAFQLLRYGIGVWETSSGKWVTQFKASMNHYGGGGQARALAITPDSQQVVGAFTPQLVVWNVHTGDRWELQGLRGLKNIRRLAFLWGGWYLAVLTEDHRLCICRFWWQSEVLACIRVPQGVTELRASPYGDTVFTLTQGGQLTAYRFRFHEAGDVSAVDGNRLTVRYAAPGASSVALAGTFNDWDSAANPLQTADGSVWCTTVVLPAGRHEYKLLVNGERWELDPHLPFEPGPLGPNSSITTPGATERWKL